MGKKLNKPVLAAEKFTKVERVMVNTEGEGMKHTGATLVARPVNDFNRHFGVPAMLVPDAEYSRLKRIEKAFKRSEPLWVAYSERRPMPSVGRVIGGGFEYGKWTMSSAFPAHLLPGEFGACDAGRTHWFAVPKPLAKPAKKGRK